MAKDNRTSIYFDREKCSFIGLESAHIIELQDTYKNSDINVELKKMALWLQSPKGIRRKGNYGFILNWLNNASPSERDSSIICPIDLSFYDSPIRPLLLDYLKELWTGKEHILEFNKIKKKS